MRDSEFEWYDAKASANLRKHGVSFEMARLVFRDNYAVDTVDLRQSYNEERLNRVAYAGDALLFVTYTMRGERTGSCQPGGQTVTKLNFTSLKTTSAKRRSIVADPDVEPPPMTPEQMRASMVPRVTTLRRALKLTQEEFAQQFKIPIGTLQDWEQSRSKPDAPARAYLMAIAGDAQGVLNALAKAPRRPEA